jgi:hypothetical protein
VVEGDTTARRFVALFRSEGVARGVLGWNMPKQTRVHRQQVADALTLAALRGKRLSTGSPARTGRSA